MHSFTISLACLFSTLFLLLASLVMNILRYEKDKKTPRNGINTTFLLFTATTNLCLDLRLLQDDVTKLHIIKSRHLCHFFKLSIFFEISISSIHSNTNYLLIILSHSKQVLPLKIYFKTRLNLPNSIMRRFLSLNYMHFRDVWF